MSSIEGAGCGGRGRKASGMRFSLRTLMAISALVAAACALLFYPNTYLNACFFTLIIFVLSYGVAVAILGTGERRAYWAGFTIFAGIYFLAAFYGDLQPNYRNEYTYRLLTSVLLQRADDWLNLQRPARGQDFGFTSLQVTMPVGHAVITMIVGAVGGLVSKSILRRTT